MLKLLRGGSRFCYAPDGGESGGSAPPPAASTPPAAVATPAPAAAQTPPAGDAPPKQFAVPDAYKDKPWASNIKSEDDVYKQLDGVQELIGKKTIMPIDYAKATPEEVATYHATLAPKEASAYAFAQPDDPVSKMVGDAFIKNGINENQGKGIVTALAPFFEKMEGDLKAQSTSEEGYMALSKAAFGDNFKETIGKVEAVLKAHAPDDATKQALDDMPNDQRIAVDKVVSKVVEGYEARIAKILKDHGVHETGAQGEGGNGSMSTDINAVRADLRKQINDLSTKPMQNGNDKKVLIDKLQATYAQK